jgi:hypothetical protein
MRKGVKKSGGKGAVKKSQHPKVPKPSHQGVTTLATNSSHRSCRSFDGSRILSLTPGAIAKRRSRKRQNELKDQFIHEQAQKMYANDGYSGTAAIAGLALDDMPYTTEVQKWLLRIHSLIVLGDSARVTKEMTAGIRERTYYVNAEFKVDKKGRYDEPAETSIHRRTNDKRDGHIRINTTNVILRVPINDYETRFYFKKEMGTEYEGKPMFVLKKSSRDGAGLGLFAGRDFAYDQVIGFFYGRLFKEGQRFSFKGRSGQYAMKNPRGGGILVSARHKKYFLIHYVNDSRGAACGPNIHVGLDLTVRVVDPNGVKEGSELFLDYGTDYWAPPEHLAPESSPARSSSTCLRRGPHRAVRTTSPTP